jgi:hypothetical protein
MPGQGRQGFCAVTFIFRRHGGSERLAHRFVPLLRLEMGGQRYESLGPIQSIFYRFCGSERPANSLIPLLTLEMEGHQSFCTVTFELRPKVGDGMKG